MFGVAVVGGDAAQTPQQDAPLAGVGFDIAVWHGRFGIAGEGSARWDLEDGAGARPRALVLGASARVRVLDTLMPSLVEPRDVELGVELQAIVERTWWNVPQDTDPTAYGVGLALRFRGGGDPDGSTLLAESRFFLRVMASRWSDPAVIARTSGPAMAPPRSFTVLLGIGASFGAGTPAYANRFRLRPFQPTLL